MDPITLISLLYKINIFSPKIDTNVDENKINQKRKQGCADILFSKIFFVNYKPESKPLGVNKFNCIALNKQYSLIPLGGINSSNLNKLKTVASEGIAILSELKKKPAIISRLF